MELDLVGYFGWNGQVGPKTLDTLSAASLRNSNDCVLENNHLL